jgi:SAM-dependent methyltransferase
MREASAMTMPFPDGSFDIVYCQLGLQFFPDRRAALREMYRVPGPGGRLGLMVWRSIEYSPGFEAFADMLARHVSSEAARTMRAPFALGDADELRELIRAAGFGEIAIRQVTGTVRFPSATRFVQDQVAGSSLAGQVAKVSGEARAALVRDIGEALRPYLAGDALAFPIEAHLASAKKGL